MTVPMSAVVRSHDDESGSVAPNNLPVRDLGDIDEPTGRHTGARQPPRAKTSMPQAAPATPDMSSVGPGHIWYVPGGDTGKAKAKGEPSSAGSHNIGSAGSTR